MRSYGRYQAQNINRLDKTSFKEDQMAKTQVLNTEEARHLASFIRSLSADIQTLQTNMQNKLAGTTFSGGASDVAAGVMSEFKARIQDHKVRLDQYSTALDTMANSADTTESTAIAGLQVNG
jgi:hypothetical protein